MTNVRFLIAYTSRQSRVAATGHYYALTAEEAVECFKRLGLHLRGRPVVATAAA